MTVEEWFERCKSCVHVKITSDEIICLKKGECRYTKRKYVPDEMGQMKISHGWYVCHRCLKITCARDMHRQQLEGKVFWAICKECFLKENRVSNSGRKAEVRTGFPETKYCPRCKETKSYLDFSVKDKERFQLRSYCKPCVIEMFKEVRRNSENGKPTNET